MATFKITEYHFKDVIELNLSFHANGVQVTVGDTFESGARIDVYAPDGFEFEALSNGSPNGSFRPIGDSTRYFSWGDNTSHIYYERLTGSSLSRFTFGIKELPKDDTKGLNVLYSLSNDMAKKFIRSKYRTNTGEEVINHKNHVISMLDIPFKISDDFISKNDETVKLSTYETDITGDLLESDSYILELGSISVPDSTGNALSRINTVCILHLPYTESVTLESDYVIGETISIQYVINLYDGLTVANISSSKIDGVILSQNIDLNVAYPFAMGDAIPAINDPHNIVMSVSNGVDTPYVELLQNTAILENGFFTVPVIDEIKIGDCDGFVRVENVDLKTTATTQEKQTIINQLTNGVIL